MYNGLQRPTCRNCQKERCELKIPENIVQCEDCGFGAVRGQKFIHTLAGRDVQGVCPVCGAKWPE